jgi:LmbE family N-acetylglucosaminyl deacetylase
MIQLAKDTAEIYAPDGAEPVEALKRTTHLAIGAHQDDLEIMAAEGVLACFGRSDAWFTGVVATNGAGSPRTGLYADYTDEQMQQVRRVEQKKAAVIGEYSAVVFLNHTSSELKNPAFRPAVEDIARILDVARPAVVYTHNLADKHPTHVAVALRTIAAIRSLPHDARPHRLLGCEVWRDLDWLSDKEKVIFRLDGHENLLTSLVGVFDSQIAGGKRYDLATMGRRRANATYLESHGTDTSELVNFGMDLSALITDDSLDPIELTVGHIERFASEVRETLGALV